MITVDARGDACPIPVVKTKKAIDALTGNETVEVLVDNETALQNVSKAARAMGFETVATTLGENEFKITVKAVKTGADPGSAEVKDEAACC